MSVLRSAFRGGCALGLIGFLGGYVGPIVSMPESNQGPLIGIFFTGPLGFVIGMVLGALAGWLRPPRG